MNPLEFHRPLAPESLRRLCDSQEFSFQTTEELEELHDLLGQDRAVAAMDLGISMRHEGYHLFVMGPSGVGKRTAVMQALGRRAAAREGPGDWIYVNNFEDLRKPRAVPLPAGRGVRFRQDIEALIEDLTNAIPAALETDEHKSRLQEIEHEQSERQSSAFSSLSAEARERHIQLIRTPGGFALAPLHNGEVLSPDEYQKLPEPERQKIQETVADLQSKLQELVEQVPKWNKETRDKIKELNRATARLAVGHLMTGMKERYSDLPLVRGYLDDMEKDVVDRVDEFQPQEESPAALFGGGAQKPAFDDYEVNLLVDNSTTSGTPILEEDHPSYHNLLGRVEHESHMGALTTDFTLIKAGALHRANGGYLLLDAQKLLSQPYSWEGLKRALASRSIKIESLGEMLSLISTVSLEPEPIPLDVKVILMGDRFLYYLLQAYDPDFSELFKVAADFSDEVERTPANSLLYARFLATLVKRDRLRPLDRDAVAATLEHASRLADDSQRYSTHMRSLADLLREADHWAERAAATVVGRTHVEQAIEQRRYRSERIRERVHEEIERGTVFIDTTGVRVGQVNGLSVIDLGNVRFGQPSRITATARLGRGEVLDIERETKLGGAIHSKGVLILSSLLAQRYARRQPLPIAATLAFEQSYGMVDGDSASMAELAALVSAIADLPVHQCLAVTGSINQLGEVQPIGGVNEKIEGFFDVCRRKGLDGAQGVVIPHANLPHLMLRADVVDACRDGRFHVFAVRTVDEGLQLLLGLPAGEADARGQYPTDSVHGRVLARIEEWLRLRRQFVGESKGESSNETPRE
ncbi:MAG: ATP-binding protein [Pirellulales bacterium]